MKEMRCIPSCTYDKYIVRKWYDSNFDMLAYQFGDDQRDGANFEVSMILSQQEILIIIDITDAVKDIISLALTPFLANFHLYGTRCRNHR